MDSEDDLDSAKFVDRVDARAATERYVSAKTMKTKLQQQIFNQQTAEIPAIVLLIVLLIFSDLAVFAAVRTGLARGKGVHKQRRQAFERASLLKPLE